MKNYFLLGLIGLFCFCISCKDTDPDPMDENEEEMEGPDCSAQDERSLELVTGIKFFDENGAAIGQVGNPNVTQDPAVKVYPNPSNGNISISKDTDIFYTFYLFQCEKDTTCNDIDYTSYEYVYTDVTLQGLEGITFGLESQNLQTQLGEELDPGYYKMVFHADGESVIVHNMYIDSEKTANEIVSFLGGEF